MGPLELADLVGLDSRLRNMEYLYQNLGEKYRPSPLLVKYVKAGSSEGNQVEDFMFIMKNQKGDMVKWTLNYLKISNF